MDAATDLLARRPAASVEEIATAAGVARQTIYAHFPTRDTLVGAVVDVVADRAVAAIGSADVDSGTAMAALRRWLDAAWSLLERYPILLSPVFAAGPGDELERHAPMIESLLRLIRRGQRSGEFDGRRPPEWFVAAMIGMGHAAGGEVAAGRMSAVEAGEAFRDGVLRILANA